MSDLGNHMAMGGMTLRELRLTLADRDRELGKALAKLGRAEARAQAAEAVIERALPWRLTFLVGVNGDEDMEPNLRADLFAALDVYRALNPGVTWCGIALQVEREQAG